MNKLRDDIIEFYNWINNNSLDNNDINIVSEKDFIINDFTNIIKNELDSNDITLKNRLENFIKELKEI